jgi:hypothetical protein
LVALEKQAMSGKYNRSGIAALSLVAVLAGACVAGCSGTTSKHQDSASDSPSTSTATSGTASSGSPTQSSGSPTHGPGAGGGARRSTANAAVVKWVRAILANKVTQACLASAQPASGGKPASATTMAQCGPNGTLHQQQTAVVKSLHASFTPDHPTKPAKVTVNGMVTHGSTGQVTGDHVVVDGSKLTDIVYAHSKGVAPGQSQISITTVQIKGAWYVGDFHLNA